MSDDSESDDQKPKKAPIIKPHMKHDGKDYYAQYLQQSEESESQAPLLVVVQGPKKSGKTTLIKSLVKHYTNQKIQQPIGPITVRSGKNSRVTFIECPSELHAMMDLAKVADLALILVDASIGFEMETFEYLSLLNNHGFPNVMGVLTHMDFFKDNKQLRKTRKKYKKRFEYEVGSGYKLFYLTGLKNDLYHKQDTLNLARYISIIKYTPVRWKSEHPFILADRFERQQKHDEQADEEEGENVTFWGYIRGCTYRVNDRMHIVGVGDFYLKSIDNLSDPVEIEQKQQIQPKEGDDQPAKPKKHRTLKQTDKIIYAPMTSLGYLNFDSTAGYINIPDRNVIFTDRKKLEADGWIMQEEKKEQQKDGEEVEEEEIEEEDEEDQKFQLQEGVQMVRQLQQLKEGLDQKLDREDAMELLDGIIVENEEKQMVSQMLESKQQSRDLIRLKNKMSSALIQLQQNATVLPINDELVATDLHELIYGSKNSLNNFDSSRFVPTALLTREEYQEEMREYFVTGFYENQDFEDLEGKEMEEEGDEEEEENVEQQQEKKDKRKSRQEQKQIEQAEQQEQEKQRKQRQIIVDSMITNNLGMYRRGSYVKIVLKGVKKEKAQQIKSDYPIILARVNVGEDNQGFIKVKIKKHRWYANIMKSNDPVIFSVGWRRFQTIPVYCVEDQNDRLRFVKYTPEYEYCYAVFYGNFAPQGTGIVCTQTLSNKISKFRLAATGIILELNHSFDVMKKLKLVGEPFKIYKNTAFIKGMFNSSLEVSKFQGGMIKTVSGLRGHIKKSCKVGPEGSFRATFEDKIVLSDLVFCRTWVRVDIEKYYRMVGNYLEGARLLKTMWELRQEKKLPIEINVDSTYRDVERVAVKFAPLKVPKRLEESLPFESKQKVLSMSLKERIRRKESKFLPLKEGLSEKEKEVYSLIQRLNTLKNEKEKKRAERDAEKKKIKQAREEGQKSQLEMNKKKFKQEKQKDKFRKKNRQQEE